VIDKIDEVGSVLEYCCHLSQNLLNLIEGPESKDRLAPLPISILEMLQNYCRDYRPKQWLLEGQIAGNPYSDKVCNRYLNQL
jgi:integrase/recombinase XerD